MTAMREHTVEADATEAALHVTDSAAQKIRALQAKHPEADGLRVSVHGGGCSGLQYDFGMDTLHPRDHVIEHAEARVMIDPKSLIYLRGSTFDYVKTLMTEEFQIDNPNASSSCGCGVSFNV